MQAILASESRASSLLQFAWIRLRPHHQLRPPGRQKVRLREPLQRGSVDGINMGVVVPPVVDGQAVERVEPGLHRAGRVGLQAHPARGLEPDLTAPQFLRLDPALNDTGAGDRLLSPADSPVAVLALATNEELIVARRAFAILGDRP